MMTSSSFFMTGWIASPPLVSNDTVYEGGEYVSEARVGMENMSLTVDGSYDSPTVIAGPDEVSIPIVFDPASI